MVANVLSREVIRSFDKQAVCGEFFGVSISSVRCSDGQLVLLHPVAFPDLSNAMVKLIDCIDRDTKAGKRHKIHRVRVSPRVAVVLYHEGLITDDLLDHATRGHGYIDIPGVKIDGGDFTVRVLNNAQYEIDTIDSNRRIIAV